MFFKWLDFCRRHRITYIERGPNTAHGHISIKCPFCGSADPSEHMGLHTADPRDPKWGCLRNAKHRGRDPTYLVRALLHCSVEAAKLEVKAQRPEDDMLATVMGRLRTGRHKMDKPREQNKKLEFPFPQLASADNRYTAAFLGYLSSRGFEPVRDFCNYYDLRYCLTGRWRWRIVVPFIDGGDLVGWTGRSISPLEKLRYDTLSPKEGALYDPTSFVMNKSRVASGSGTLIITEGPFDALKLDWFYETEFPVEVTCLFGQPKQGQIEFLGSVARRYHRVGIVLDADAYANATHLAGQLRELSGGKDVRVLRLTGVKDPGEMNKQQVRELIKEVTM